jgi:hypothetical protein
VRKVLSLIAIALVLIFTIALFTACAPKTEPTPTPPQENQEEENKEEEVEQPQAEENEISEYFPLTQGSTWKYKGEGNEYASFSREVLFTEGNKAQIREDNGGTVSAAVFTISENDIIRTFFQGEAYGETNFLDEEPTENTVILKTLLEKGTKWEEPNGIREIESIDETVETPAGEFTDCIKVKITSTGSTLYEYFKAGVGMVKREFISGDTKVTSSLEEYDIKE